MKSTWERSSGGVTRNSTGCFNRFHAKAQSKIQKAQRLFSFAPLLSLLVCVKLLLFSALIILKLLQALHLLCNFFLPTLLCSYFPGMVGCFIILLLHAVMFFHDRIINRIHIPAHCFAIENICFQRFVQLTSMQLCKVEMSLLMCQDVIVLDAAPRTGSIEPAFDPIVHAPVAVSKFNRNTAACKCGIGGTCIRNSPEICPGKFFLGGPFNQGGGFFRLQKGN